MRSRSPWRPDQAFGSGEAFRGRSRERGCQDAAHTGHPNGAYIVLVRPHDTSPEALTLQHEAFRRMTPAERFAAAVEMSEGVRALAETGIRQRNPDYSDEQVRRTLVEIMLGPELAAKVQAPARSR